MLKAILRREGRGTQGRSTPLDLIIGIKKLISNTSVVYDTKKKFSVPLGKNRKIYANKAVQRRGTWGGGTDGRGTRGRKNNKRVRYGNNEALAFTTVPIRSHHKKYKGGESLQYQSQYDGASPVAAMQQVNVKVSNILRGNGNKN